MSAAGPSDSSRRSRRSSSSSRKSSSSSDSSLDSVKGPSEVHENRWHNFRIVGDRLRCTGPDGDDKNISGLGKVAWFKEVQPNAPPGTGANVACFNIDRVTETLEEWTSFFIENKRIKLTGSRSCANKLSSRGKKDVISLQADLWFPYYSYIDRQVNGVVLPAPSKARYTKVHLDSESEQITLAANTFYFIGGDIDEPWRLPSCNICNEYHDIVDTPCPRAQHFVATEGDRRLMIKASKRCSGARVLCVRPNGETLFNPTMSEKWLCSSCEQKAVSEKNVWYKLDGTCKVESCLNDDDYCRYVTEGCKHYVFMSEGVEHNLSSYEIPCAVAEGRLQPVMGAAFDSYEVKRNAQNLRHLAREAFKKKESISLETIAEQVGCSVQEVLTIAMYDTLWADCIDRNKLFTLNKINGFVENPKTAAIGPWLDGRIVKGPDGRIWHVPRGEPVTIKTRDSVSYISKWRKSDDNDDESDLLGRFVA